MYEFSLSWVRGFVLTFFSRLSNLWNQTGRYYSFGFYWFNIVEFKSTCGGYFFPCKSPVLPRLGVDYYCFHDVDVAPQGETLKEFQSNLDVISDKLLSKQKETGVKLFLCTMYLNSMARQFDPCLEELVPSHFAMFPILDSGIMMDLDGWNSKTYVQYCMVWYENSPIPTVPWVYEFWIKAVGNSESFLASSIQRWSCDLPKFWLFCLRMCGWADASKKLFWKMQCLRWMRAACPSWGTNQENVGRWKETRCRDTCLLGRPRRFCNCSQHQGSECFEMYNV